MSARSAAVCPGLKREGDTYICSYTGKPVNPYAWYCFLDYITCPIYIRHRTTTAETKPAEIKPEEKVETTVTTVEARPSEVYAVQSSVELKDLEELVVEDLKKLIVEYENRVQELDRKWSDYEQSVSSVRTQFDRERFIIEHHLELLKRTIVMYELDLRELEYRKEIGIVEEEQYSKLREEIESRLDRLRREYEELKKRYENIISGIFTHVRRVLTIVPTPEVGKLRLVLTRLNELLRDGKITQDVYDKLKRELESIVGGE